MCEQTSRYECFFFHIWNMQLFLTQILIKRISSCITVLKTHKTQRQKIYATCKWQCSAECEKFVNSSGKIDGNPFILWCIVVVRCFTFFYVHTFSFFFVLFITVVLCMKFWCECPYIFDHMRQMNLVPRNGKLLQNNIFFFGSLNFWCCIFFAYSLVFILLSSNR